MPRVPQNTSTVSTRSHTSRASQKEKNPSSDTSSSNTTSTSTDASGTSTDTTSSSEPQQHRRARMPKRQQKEWKKIKSDKLLIPRLSFSRVVKEIAQQYNPYIHFQSTAMLALQDATEQYITGILTASNACTMHRQRVTLNCKDMLLVKELTDVLGLNQ